MLYSQYISLRYIFDFGCKCICYKIDVWSHMLLDDDKKS